jgi:hypothetical protein
VVVDEYGAFVGRLDLGWPQWKVAVEYDGPQHWDDPQQHARDIDRLADLAAQGWTVIRVSRDLLRYRSPIVLGRTRDAMRSAGWPHWASVRLEARVSWLDQPGVFPTSSTPLPFHRNFTMLSSAVTPFE